MRGDRDPGTQGRVRLMYAMSALMLLVLVGRLFYVQVFGGQSYLRLSEDNHFREFRISAPRGLILDRNGAVLANNHAACEASLSTRTLRMNPEVVTETAAVLGLPADEVVRKLEWALAEGRPRVRIASNLSKEQILSLEEKRQELPGLQLRDWARRTYPAGPLAAHLLGYVGEVGEPELRPGSLDPRAYRSGDLIGRAGVEMRYEWELRGADGKELILVNARGTHLETVKFEEPEPGSRLYLTLDLKLTAALDSALAYWGAGAGLVIDVRSGEILAAASRPSFDPNLFVGGIPEKLWQELTQDPARPLFNRITQATYPPASALKPLLAFEALESGLITPLTHFDSCSGGRMLGDRYFGCWNEQGHGDLILKTAISRSCDVYFYQLGDLLGIEGIAAGARRFGLGTSPPGELPASAGGLVPDAAWYNQHLGRSGWSRGHVWNVSIGQGEMLASCLQMACAYAAIANGGVIPEPRLVKRIESSRGEVLREMQRPAGKALDLDPRALAEVKRGLEAVMSGPLGTARDCSLPMMATAGKTGTVQNPHGLEHGWFCGYAPAESPEIAIALIVEHGEHGSDIAPMFRHLVATWFELPVVPIRRSQRKGD